MIKTKFKVIHISQGEYVHDTPPYYTDIYFTLWASRRGEEQILDEIEEAYGEDKRWEVEEKILDNDLDGAIKVLEEMGYEIILHNRRD